MMIYSTINNNTTTNNNSLLSYFWPSTLISCSRSADSKNNLCLSCFRHHHQQLRTMRPCTSQALKKKEHKTGLVITRIDLLLVHWLHCKRTPSISISIQPDPHWSKRSHVKPWRYTLRVRSPHTARTLSLRSKRRKTTPSIKRSAQETQIRRKSTSVRERWNPCVIKIGRQELERVFYRLLWSQPVQYRWCGITHIHTPTTQTQAHTHN